MASPDAFDVEEISIGDDEMGIRSSPADPSVGPGVPASLSTTIIENGRFWTKTGPLDTDWVGGAYPGVDTTGGGGSATLVLTLTDGSPCNITISGSLLQFTLTDGSPCNIPV